jgi:hypothetical protein
MSDEEHLSGVEGGAEQEGVSEGYEWELTRVELVRRGGVALSPEELARILMGGEDASLGRPRGGGV